MRIKSIKLKRPNSANLIAEMLKETGLVDYRKSYGEPTIIVDEGLNKLTLVYDNDRTGDKDIALIGKIIQEHDIIEEK